jgi:hypothetical protein
MAMGILPIVIYSLCLGAAALCTMLLLRGYRRSGTRLLLWSGLCFAFLSLNSLIVILDILVFPGRDLQLLRHGASLAAVGTLLVGLIWDGE